MNEIDEVKSRINIADYIGEQVKLKKTGRNFKGLCPFHNEKTPSFIVSPERQIFHCFGCGKGGSVIDFVMEYDNVDFVEALETLADRAGVKLTRRPADTPEAKLKTKILEINHLASEYYQYLLTSHKVGEKARKYLKERGVTNKTVKTFGLGYSPDSWEGMLKFLNKKNYTIQLLEKAGLIIRSARGGYDRFRGRVMFTLKDHRGNIVGFSGRLLDKNAKQAKYINTPDTPVYNKSNVLFGLDITKKSIQKEKSAVIVEGEFDVISSFQAGISNIVAIKGSALTEGHVHLLRRFTERVIFALDSDIAGDEAARRGIEIADKAGLDMRVVSIPKGKDPDDAVREDPGSFKKSISQAQPVYDYLIDSAVKRFNKNTAYGKKKISEELLPILSKIENLVVQAHYVKKVAKTLEVGEESITEGIRKTVFSKKSFVNETEIRDSKTELTRPEKIELYILALLLQSNTREFFEEMTENVKVADFAHLGARRIFENLRKFLKSEEKFLIKDFADSLPKELLPVLDKAFLWDLSDIIEDSELTARTWMKTLRELRKAVLKRKIKEQSERLSKADKPSKKEKDTDKIQEKLAALTNELRTLEKLSTL